MNQFLNKRKSNGFTLLEIIIAIFFVTVGMGGAFTVIQKSFSILSLSGSRLVAANLAQEGIEVVRNIRDTNWLESEQYDKGLGVPHPDLSLVDYQVQYDDGEADIVVCAVPCAYDDMVFLNIDATNGFYNYDAGNATKFKRKITINKITADSMKITVDVIWKERAGKEYTYTAHHLLYDWK